MRTRRAAARSPRCAPAGVPIAYRETSVGGVRRPPGPGRRKLRARHRAAWTARSDRDPPRHERCPCARGASRGVRRDGQPRAANAAGADPRLRRDAAPLRPRPGRAAGLRRADRRGDRPPRVARRPGARRDASPGRPADPGPVDDDVRRARRAAARRPRDLADGADRLVEVASADLPPVDVDVARVGQILANLVGNALKYAPDGSPIVVGAAIATDRGSSWRSTTRASASPRTTARW